MSGGLLPSRSGVVLYTVEHPYHVIYFPPTSFERNGPREIVPWNALRLARPG